MLRPLSDFSLEKIVNSINKIFEDYQYSISWRVEKFSKDIKEYSIDLDASIAYCNRRGDIEALSLTCIRGKNARMDSFGVVKSKRNEGLGTFLLNEQISLLRHKNVKTYELEVLYDNKKAIDFYKKNGFKFVSVLISLFSPLPPKKKYKNFYADFDKAIDLSKKYSHLRDLCWLRSPDSLEKSDRYDVLVNDEFYVFYFTDQNQCYMVDAFGSDIEKNLYSFFQYLNLTFFSIVSLSLEDELYKVLSRNNFMEFSRQWKMIMEI